MNELLKYADWLDENIKDEQFDFLDVVSQVYPDTNCGSVCCAIGWLPAYSTRCRWQKMDGLLSVIVDGDDNPDLMFGEEVEQFFGIPHSDGANLFAGNACNNQGKIEGWGDFPVCDHYCTVKELTNAMRHYVEIKS